MVLKDTERSVASDIKEMMNNIIKEKNLALGQAKVELRDSKGNQPDIVVFNKLRQPLCVVEIKRPFIPPYQVELFDQAYGYADTEGVGYFATFNLNTLVLWKTFEKDVPLLNRRFKEYSVLKIITIDELKKASVLKSLKTGLETFLLDLSALLTAREEEILPSLKLDIIFINYLHSLIESMYIPLSESLIKRISHEPKFRKQVFDWFTEQGWNFTTPADAVERLSRQYILLLLNKIMFYNILRTEYPQIRPDDYDMIGLPKELPKLRIPTDIEDGGILSHLLEGFFKKVLKIDYKTIYEPGFLDEIELPLDLIPHIRNLANEFDKYDFTTIDYEVMGNIFESLIPPEDRHKFGQYFTRSDVVDLIVASCIRDKNDIAFDPACGAGTFLIRSYSRLKFLGMKGPHRDFIEKLWGVDIAKFPAHLTTINLVVKDLSERFNFPRVACDDFFRVLPGTLISESAFPIEGLNSGTINKAIPKFSALITNPPYTRQEEMEEKTKKGYKEDIRELIKGETGISIGKRSSIYSYFFFHGSQFLDKNGKMGLITSNSWLDVDYGKFLQEFFLKNFKIKMIIESKVERFFTDADINTCITILEKCNGGEERNKNIVKFVQLRRNLLDVLANFNGSKKPYEEWDDDEKWETTDKLIKWIEKTDDFIIDEKFGLRVYPIDQKKLWDEGLDAETNKYEGAKWGKYLRAPDIFFKVLEKGKNIFIPLKDVGDVQFGIKTGANNFFYLTEDEIKKWGIERKFWMHKIGNKWIPNYILKSPRECSKIYVDRNRLSYRVLMIHNDKKELKGTNVLRYIQYGEEQGFHERPTCAQRQKLYNRWLEKNKKDRTKEPTYFGWYDIGDREVCDGLWVYAINIRYAVFQNSSTNIFFDHELSELYIDRDKQVVLSLLNSSLLPLFSEFSGRVVLGLGALQTNVYEIEIFPIVNPSKITKRQKQRIIQAFNKLKGRKLGTIFEEIGADRPEDVSLDKVKSDRRKLDKIVLGDILGLSEDEQLEVYKSIIDLVRARLEKAKNAKNRKKKKQGFEANVEQIAILVFHEIHKELLREIKEFEMPKPVAIDFKGEASGKIEVKVDLSGSSKVIVGNNEIDCKSLDEAHLLKYQLLMGQEKLIVSTDSKAMCQLANKFKNLDKSTKKELKSILEMTVSDEKMREKIKDKIYRTVWYKIGRFKVE